ncbi:MAG: hypothetical protein AB1500_07640 [Bacillota bacterium]
MEIIIDIPEDEWDSETPLGVKQSFIAGILEELKPISTEIKVKPKDIGWGSNWPVILLLIGNLFLQGRNINEAVDGWIGLARKFVRCLDKIRGKAGVTLVSREAAKLIALDHMSKNKVIKELKEKDGNTIIVIGQENVAKGLASSPLSLYVFFFIVNRESVYIIGVRSVGKIEFSYEMDLETDKFLERYS